MRLISNEPNIMKIHDNLSDSDMHIYYRSPTVKEVAGYTNSMTKRVRNRIINCTGECRQKHGRDILEGFRDGDFGIMKDGKVSVISSDPKSQNYDPKWKDLFCEHAADLVERLAIHAFENTAEMDVGVDLSASDEENGEIKDPN